MFADYNTPWCALPCISYTWASGMTKFKLTVLKTTSLVLCSSIRRHTTSASPFFRDVYSHWCSRTWPVSSLWSVVPFLFLLLDWNTSIKRNFTLTTIWLHSGIYFTGKAGHSSFFFPFIYHPHNNQSVPQHPLTATIVRCLFSSITRTNAYKHMQCVLSTVVIILIDVPSLIAGNILC